MDSTTYSYLHKLPKDLNSVRGDILYCAKFGQQKLSEHFKITYNLPFKYLFGNIIKSKGFSLFSIF